MACASVPSVCWATIHRQPFVVEDRCWTFCNGGFCCSNHHPQFQFQLIPTRGTTIIYLDAEYEWLARHGAVPGPGRGDAVPNVLSFDFGGPRPLAIVQMPCRLLGKCQGAIDKPLLCRLYPMLPVLDVDGHLEAVYPASIFDLTMEVRGLVSPCTVLDKREIYRARWQASDTWLDCLRHPYLIFHLQAAKHFAEVYSERLRSSQVLHGLSDQLFWKKWEMQYLAGELVDSELLARKIRATYQDLVDRYGEFFEPPSEPFGPAA